MMATRRRFLGAVAAAVLLVSATAAHAAAWRVAFQAIPEQTDAIYTKQVAKTAAVISELGPPILGAIGLDPNSFDADVVAGGYRGHINPSVVMYVDGDAVTAGRVAAACGIVFEQASVLDWHEDQAGPDLAVDVAFPSLTPTLTDFFFRTAIAVNRGLAGGFTARDNRLLFINLRGADGKPLSGLGDPQFAEALRTAAKAFGNIATVSTFRLEAHLVTGHDGAYKTVVGPTALPELDKLRTRRAALVAVTP
jgi:hypothetical protein